MQESVSDTMVRFFFYTAPIIGLVLGVFYLKEQKRKEVEITISKVRLSENIKSILYKTDTKKCVNRGEFNRELQRLIDRLSNEQNK